MRPKRAVTLLDLLRLVEERRRELRRVFVFGSSPRSSCARILFMLALSRATTSCFTFDCAREAVEALLELAEARDLLDQRRVRVAEVPLDGRAVLHQLLRLLDQPLLLAARRGGGSGSSRRRSAR